MNTIQKVNAIAAQIRRASKANKSESMRQAWALVKEYHETPLPILALIVFYECKGLSRKDAKAAAFATAGRHKIGRRLQNKFSMDEAFQKLMNPETPEIERDMLMGEIVDKCFSNVIISSTVMEPQKQDGFGATHIEKHLVTTYKFLFIPIYRTIILLQSNM